MQYQADMHMYCSLVKISDIVQEDEGTYEMWAKNREGEATNTLILNVVSKLYNLTLLEQIWHNITRQVGDKAEEKKQEEKKETKKIIKKKKKQAAEPPKVVKPLTPVVCKVGELVRMETVITGTPAPSLTWQRDGGDLPAHVRVVAGDDGLYALVIDASAVDDEGDYTVRAENEAGSAQTSANLCVQGKLIEAVF